MEQCVTRSEKSALKVSYKLATAQYIVRPVNWELLTAKVNSENPDRLDKQTWAKVLRPPSIQSILPHVGIITATTTDKLLNAKNIDILLGLDAMIRMKAGAIALLVHISLELAQSR